MTPPQAAQPELRNTCSHCETPATIASLSDFTVSSHSDFTVDGCGRDLSTWELKETFTGVFTAGRVAKVAFDRAGIPAHVVYHNHGNTVRSRRTPGPHYGHVTATDSRPLCRL